MSASEDDRLSKEELLGQDVVGVNFRVILQMPY